MEKKFGVNVIGYINGEFGLGEAIRLIIKALNNAKVPVSLINFEVDTYHRHDDKTFDSFTLEAPYSINLVLLGPTEGKRILTHFSNQNLFKDKYNIFFLNWESEHFPQEYVSNINYFDEIWVPAQYCQNVISKYVQAPVNVIHYPIDILIDNNEDVIATTFYDKSKFNFLFMFDYNSSLDRKNTLNLIEAFEKAFGKNDTSVSLIIKTSKSNKFAKDKERLFNRIKGFENIKIVEKIFEKQTLHKIIKGCDSYISLHRSEGFGLTMAEAMFFAKPVIATGYSGNLEFMKADNSFLVNYEMSTVDSNVFNYDKNTIWSEPDTNHAAELMRLVRDNSDKVQEIARKGKETMLHDFSTEKVGSEIKNRLELIFKDFKPNLLKNDLVSLYIDNENYKKELKIVNKSKLIKIILTVKAYFRERKKQRKFKRKNKSI